MIAFFISIIRQFYSTGSRCENKLLAADYPWVGIPRVLSSSDEVRVMFGVAPFIKPTPAMFIAGDNIRPPESQTSEKIP